MSAELRTLQAEKPPARSRLVRSNRRQVVLFAVLTLILSIATVWGTRIWLKDSETLVFAVGDANGPEARFA
ncbi:MAG TPA: C4-dicarboxylate ABC transporter substrate-binding protein, partial [Bradyrhizobium sp.]